MKIVGSIVLTDYNKKTYRVDDVDFSASPESEFYWNGKAVTFVSYLFQVSIL
jgi:aubergine-like protein